MATDVTRRALLAAAATPLLSACERLGVGGKTAYKFANIDISGVDYAKTLSLTDPDGRRRSLAEFKGKVVVVFFGYTQCPDVCPTTLSELAEVKRALGADGDRLQGIFVSVDPDRDTPEILKAYVESFDKGFVALRGTADETKAAAAEFKVFYAKVPGKTEQTYTVDHTAGAYVFDTQGRIRLFARYGGEVARLATDIKALLAEN